jgi:hypothetical protein
MMKKENEIMLNLTLISQRIQLIGMTTIRRREWRRGTEKDGTIISKANGIVLKVRRW